jgi:hypothetical protein
LRLGAGGSSSPEEEKLLEGGGAQQAAAHARLTLTASAATAEGSLAPASYAVDRCLDADIPIRAGARPQEKKLLACTSSLDPSSSFMFKQVILILGLAAFAVAQSDPDNQNPQLTQVVDSVTMQLVGNSGQIKLFPSSESNRFIRIKMSKVQELDASGQAVGGNENTIDFASLARGNKCANGAGWSALEKKTSSSGKTFFTSTFTCSAIPVGSGSNTVTFKLRVSASLV